MTGFPSPNFGERRGGVLPDLVVLHYTVLSCAAARARLCDPATEVSAHWLIDADGQSEQLVDEAARAWHAGAGGWGPVTDVNSRSIGIELANSGETPFALPQMLALERLLAGVMGRWGIPPERVIGHSDMAPARKRDPGPRFDWRGLAQAGLSVWPETGTMIGTETGTETGTESGTESRAESEGETGLATLDAAGMAAPEAAAFDAALATFGYPPAPPAARLAAFRLRFFPGLAGPLTPAEVAAAADLAARHPVAGFPVDRRGATT